MASQKIAICLVAVALFVGSMTAHADDFSAGINANQRGDYATALRIFRQLADQGDAGAQVSLGQMYEYGRGVIQDYETAVRWFRKAAEQSDAVAQFSLGYMYEHGQGVTQDYVQAHMWYNLAAARDLSAAEDSRNLLARQMTPAQIAEAQRMAREWYPKKK